MMTLETVWNPDDELTGIGPGNSLASRLGVGLCRPWKQSGIQARSLPVKTLEQSGIQARSWPVQAIEQSSIQARCSPV
ncbi:Hypp4948 [Branchiostoma lanceolatum]|uniref:Hypp4948 protein n=1 Tax=Branchiostoma lanceolatum TaxID=7740 RepID=A0A8K0F369_BRALA|nr:Hypp4948 [Branchiostoma lanceolatum]